jgi:transposase
MVLLETMLARAGEAGLLASQGRVRTDSTHVLARIRALNWLEKVGEAVRLALEAVARVALGWLGARVPARFEGPAVRALSDAVSEAVTA